MPKPATEKNISDILQGCLDPELNVDIVALGLIYSIKIENNELDILMTLTSPSCPYADQILADMRKLIKRSYPELLVKINITFDPPWDPSRITKEASAKLMLNKTS